MNRRAHPPRGPAHPRPDGAGYGATGGGFYVWYETRLETQSWLKELGAFGRNAEPQGPARGRRRRRKARPKPPAQPSPRFGVGTPDRG